MLGKVTAFVVRITPAGTELLLFERQHADIQLPAGTIEPGEAPEAARRELLEEAGLCASRRRAASSAGLPLRQQRR